MTHQLTPASHQKLQALYRDVLAAQAKYDLALDCTLAAIDVPNNKGTGVDLDTGVITVPDAPAPTALPPSEDQSHA